MDSGREKRETKRERKETETDTERERERERSEIVYKLSAHNLGDKVIIFIQLTTFGRQSEASDCSERMSADGLP